MPNRQPSPAQTIQGANRASANLGDLHFFEFRRTVCSFHLRCSPPRRTSQPHTRSGPGYRSGFRDHIITQVPAMQIATPIQSRVSGRLPSMHHPQKTESTMKTAPYAA